MARCSNCESEDREGHQFCESCGAWIELESGKPELRFVRMNTEDEGPAASMNEGEGAVTLEIEEPGPTESTGEPESTADSMDTEEPGPAESSGEPDLAADSTEAESEGAAEFADAADGVPAEPSKTGYLVFPDGTEQPIPPSQWLIGRADLAKYLSDPEKASEISRGHLTVFQDGDKFFIEDGTTMVQVRPSANKTWLVRGGSRILITGTGRNELQDDDEIDVAELVRLHFVVT